MHFVDGDGGSSHGIDGVAGGGVMGLGRVIHAASGSDDSDWGHSACHPHCRRELLAFSAWLSRYPIVKPVPLDPSIAKLHSLHRNAMSCARSFPSALVCLQAPRILPWVLE